MDPAFGGGEMSLSRLGQAVGSTFCSDCKLALVSAGSAGGPDERDVLVAKLGGPARSPAEREWSGPNPVTSSLVFGCPDAVKENCVRDIVEWYEGLGVSITPNEVYFFDDHTGNTEGFASLGFNARQVSCQSRDGVVGLCGATPEEIVRQPGSFNC
jgi:hypothetical protein